MYRVEISQDMQNWASAKAAKSKKTKGFINNSASGRNVYKRNSYLGYLGEFAWFKSMYKEKNQKAIHADSRDYDWELNNNFYDIKSYWTTFFPMLTYTGFIPAENMDRGVKGENGFYAFVAIMEEDQQCIIIGDIQCDEFKKKAEFRKQGDPRIGRRGVYEFDCYELPFDDPAYRIY